MRLNKYLITFIIFLCLSQQAAAAPSTDLAKVFGAIATDANSREVFDFLSGKAPLQLGPERQFSKLEIYFEKPVKIDRIKLETCGEVLADGADLYLNFDEVFRFREGGRRDLDFNFSNGGKEIYVQAIVINFRRSSSVCLKKMSLELAGQPLELKVPKLILTRIETGRSHSQLENLFDSKLQTYLKLKLESGPAFIKLKWQENVSLDQILIWPGNFIDDILFRHFARPKEIEVQCDQDSKVQFSLMDEMLPQSIKLGKSYKCKTIKILFLSSFLGQKYPKEMAISEIRFLDNGQILSPDMSDAEDLKKEKIEGEFAKSNLSQILERQLISVETPKASVLRLHADGSFFLRGFDELAKENENFYIVGEMAPTSIKKNRIKMTLRGIKRSSTLEMDSLTCGRKCFQKNDYSNEKFYFEQDIQVRKGRDGFYRIDTLLPKKLRRIDFTSIRFLLDRSL